jgi:hypothetical protein
MQQYLHEVKRDIKVKYITILIYALHQFCATMTIHVVEQMQLWIAQQNVAIVLE